MEHLLRKAWLLELREPTPDFMAVYARRVKTGGQDTALKELVERLPLSGPAALRSAQGLMVLRAILLLAPWLEVPSLHGMLAAHALGLATGPAANVPEASSGAETYASLRTRVSPDMASTGIKGILAHQMEDLASRLGLGAGLLPLLQSICAALPADLYWHQRALKRLKGPAPQAPSGDPVRVICEGSLVAVLDLFGSMVRRGEPVLGFLAEAASRKLLEADRGLQGRTSWIFAYLAALAGAGPAQWLQAAALIHLFPSEEWPALEPVDGEANPGDLLEAILDADPREARRTALQVLGRVAPTDLMPILAEAVAASDPMNDGGHRLLATAAVAELLPRLDRTSQTWIVLALATSLAATQTSGDQVEMGKRAWNRVV
ncbi:hypothetical protein [Holophaga foetida]|uniref:hypothetical protein n=1 Tax=Holophaga foetida TaxID=35839 RepID=UPI0002473ACD|nr:hypothetical protein [Holophaga foetida]